MMHHRRDACAFRQASRVLCRYRGKDRMATYVALLRAVNVGGTGELPMTELRAMCAAEGFGKVRTYHLYCQRQCRLLVRPIRVRGQAGA